MRLNYLTIGCLLGIPLYLGLCLQTQGQTATWNSTGTGAWTDTTKWTWTGGTAPASGFPEAASLVFISNGGTVQLNDGIQSITNLTMNNGRLELARLETGAVLSISGSFILGSGTGTNSVLVLDGLGTELNKLGTTQSHIGSAGTATMTVSNGAKFTTAASLHVGLGSSTGNTGTGTLNVLSGGQFIVNSTFMIGHRGQGTVNVEDGGYLKTTNGYLSGYGQDGNRVKGTSLVKVSGEGSKWDVGILYIGNTGTATIVIEDEGQVISTNAAFIGHTNAGPAATPILPAALGTGTVTVKTGGLFQTALGLSVGTVGSTGTLNVASAGKVNVGGGAGVMTLGSGGNVNIGADPLLADAVPDAPGLLMTNIVTSAESVPRPLNLFHSDITGNYYLTATGAVGGKHVQITGGIQLNALTGTTTLIGANTLTGGVSIGGHPDISAKLVMTHTQALGAGFVVVKDNGTLEVGPDLNFATLGYLELQGGSALSFDAHPVGGTSVPKFNITNWLDLQLEEGEKIKIYLHGTDAISNPELYDWAFLRTGVGIFDDVTDMFEVISDVPGFYVYERSGNLVLGMAVIPEPGRAVLLLVGLMGLGLRRRR